MSNFVIKNCNSVFSACRLHDTRSAEIGHVQTILLLSYLQTLGPQPTAAHLRAGALRLARPRHLRIRGAQRPSRPRNFASFHPQRIGSWHNGRCVASRAAPATQEERRRPLRGDGQPRCHRQPSTLWRTQSPHDMRSRQATSPYPSHRRSRRTRPRCRSVSQLWKCLGDSKTTRNDSKSKHPLKHDKERQIA